MEVLKGHVQALKISTELGHVQYVSSQCELLVQAAGAINTTVSSGAHFSEDIKGFSSDILYSLQNTGLDHRTRLCEFCLEKHEHPWVNINLSRRQGGLETATYQVA